VLSAAAACSNNSNADPQAVDNEPTAAAGATTSTTTVPIVGDPVNQYTLAEGECFNRYEVGVELITTRLPCEVAHQREIYATHVHPAAFGEPWPGDDALQRFGLRLCYLGFESFVGIIFELSELTIGVLTPPQANWEDPRARFRGILCYVTRADNRAMEGSMRQRGI
jgi:hypothetical protein